MDNPYLPELEETLEYLKGAMEIHNIESLYSQYYEIGPPFSIQLATNRPQDAENNYRLATFAPGFANNTSNDKALLMAAEKTPTLHQINCTKLMYVLEGSLYLNVEGKQILYTAGSACILNPNIRHSESFSTDYQVAFFNLSKHFIDRLNNYGHGYLFEQETNFPSPTLEYLTLKKVGKIVIDKAYVDYYPVLYEDRQKKIMHDIFEQMIWILMNPDLGSTFQLQALFFNLVKILSSPEYYQTTLIHPAANADSLVFTRINQLLADRNGRIQRKELEQLLNYSGSHLSRIVKKFTGLSLFDYSMTFCLRAAAEMLLNSKDSIATIMERLQFSNQTHFYHLFHEKYGVSPKEYRNQNS